MEAQCLGCDYHKHLCIGGGLFDCEPATILNAFSGENRMVLSALLEKGIPNGFFFTRQLGVCQCCGELTVVPVACFLDTSGKAWRSAVVCVVCGAKTKLYSEKDLLVEENGISHKVACPSCGAQLLLWQIGRWD